MDFKTVINSLLKNFKKEDVRYAFIGAFAMGALGMPRATVDLDILVHLEDLPKADRIMTSLGYNCVHKTENVSQYVSPLKIFGEVDFLHAFRDISVRMLARAVEKEIFGGEYEIKVLLPEDILGLKLQAAVNDPERATREYADIESLVEYHKSALDWPLVEEYFNLFNLKEKLAELKERFKKNE